MSESKTEDATVIIVGGGFAGVGCAKVLAKHGVHTILIDRNNYHQFQPLLYQVATDQLAPSDIARPLREMFRKDETVSVKLAEVAEIDTATRTVTTTDGLAFRGDHLVLAAGSRPNFFNTPGAETNAFPLYSLNDAERLRSRILQVLEDADRDPSLVARGAVNFVIVGAGATGVETAGALADLINDVLPHDYRDLPPGAAQVHVVDPGHVVLAPFSEGVHDYAAKTLTRKGVRLVLGRSATEVAKDRVVLSDGSSIQTRTPVWAAGLVASPLARLAKLPQGRGGRVEVEPDLSVEGTDGVYVLGDMANIAGADGEALPQLGSVALQSGTWAGANILADIEGSRRKPFRYHDKGIMAMIGRNAAVAEVGAHHHELHGAIAFAAWLGVHAWLMSGVRERVDAFVSWGWDYFSRNRAVAVIDRPDAARIDWGDEGDEDEGAGDAENVAN
jgi:NADH dehydrogenase